MIKTVASLVIVATLLCTASVAFGTAEGPDFFCVKDVAKNDTLNLRESPSASAAIVAKIPHDACKLENLVQCVGRKGETIPESDAPPPDAPRPHWCKIQYKGKSGWVALRYLREDSGSP